VIDNGSVADDFAVLHKDITIIHNKANVGYATAINTGLNAVETQLTLIVNPDVSDCTDAVAGLANFLSHNDDVMIAGCRVLNPDGSEQRASRRSLPQPLKSFVSLFSLERILPGVNQHKKELPTSAQQVEALSGAFFMTRTPWFKTMGGLDEEYFMHGEDLDLFARCKKNHDKVMFLPDFTVTHMKGSSSQRNSHVVEGYKHDAMQRYYSKFLQKEMPWGLAWLIPLGIEIHRWLKRVF